MGGQPQKLELTWFNKDKALIPTEAGKYGYSWVDPKDPRYCETHTLIMEDMVRGEQAPKQKGITYSERADLEPTDDNLLILGESGDVLETLTRVPELADKYVGQVKCIYIDPPFNTAQTFANYEDNLEHSIWLTMMRDRLVHLRSLLSEDGSIWVHLDDVENHRMRVLLDEVFGASRFLGDISWEKVYSPRADSQRFSSRVDRILVYGKSDAVLVNPLVVKANLSQFKHRDEEGRPYRSDPLRKWGSNSRREDRPTLWYPIVSPTGEHVWPIKPDGTEGRWRWQQSTVKRDYDQLDWLDKGNGLQPYVRQYADKSDNRPAENLWFSKDVGNNQTSKEEIKALFPGDLPFSTPKPERLLERIIHIATTPGDIVMDIFAGSGTTAAVAQKMGRRWVTCELIENTMEQFTHPRLTKVVQGEDPGGITLTKGERIDATTDGLPEGISTEDAQKLTSLLNKTITDRDDLKKNPAIRELKSLVKTTKSKDTVNWRGGGGFTVARLSPSCFDYDPELDLVTLTEAATGQTLIESVAANLNFHLTPEHRHFHGARGLMRLVVVEGRLDRDKVDDLVAHLDADDGLTIAATEIDDGVRQYLRSLGRGCRAVHVPNDIFTYRADEEN